MIRVIFLLLGMIISCSGCGNPLPEEMDSAESAVSYERIDIAQLLSLHESQRWDLCDYEDNIALILVSDASRKDQNSMEQYSTDYYEMFVVLDTSEMKIIHQYPVEQYGICKSALQFYDGVLFSFFSPAGKKLEAGIYFLNDQGMKSIFRGNYTPFVTGPVLHRFEDDVLFSYYDCEDSSFGIYKLNSAFETESLLCFSEGETDYISDNFETAWPYYIYAVGEAKKVTFYVGSYANPTKKIQLPDGEKIHGFSVNKETLAVSVTGNGEDAESIRLISLETGELLNQVPVGAPIYAISVNENSEILGYSYSTLRPFSLQNGLLQEREFLKESSSYDFHEILSGQNNFLVKSYKVNKMPDLYFVSNSSP